MTYKFPMLSEKKHIINVNIFLYKYIQYNCVIIIECILILIIYGIALNLIIIVFSCFFIIALYIFDFSLISINNLLISYIEYKRKVFFIKYGMNLGCHIYDSGKIMSINYKYTYNQYNNLSNFYIINKYKYNITNNVYTHNNEIIDSTNFYFAHELLNSLVCFRKFNNEELIFYIKLIYDYINIPIQFRSRVISLILENLILSVENKNNLIEESIALCENMYLNNINLLIKSRHFLHRLPLVSPISPIYYNHYYSSDLSLDMLKLISKNIKSPSILEEINYLGLKIKVKDAVNTRQRLENEILSLIEDI